jgi:hypothetical protein
VYIDCVEVGCRESASRISFSAERFFVRGNSTGKKLDREREREEKESGFSSSLVVVVV